VKTLITQINIECIYNNIEERNTIFKSKKFYIFVREDIKQLPFFKNNNNVKLLKSLIRNIFNTKSILKSYFSKYVVEEYLKNVHFETELDDLIYF
jgi:hypothetical protein